MYSRALALRPLVEKRPLFLFGPRQTGKGTLRRHTFPDAHYVDLLEANTFRELSVSPESMRQTVPPQQRLVIVDEVQKVPSLLDEAQAMIERPGVAGRDVPPSLVGWQRRS